MFDLVSYIRDLRSHNYLHMNQPPPFLVEHATGTQQLPLSSSLSNYMHMLDDDITSLIGLVCEAVLYGKQFHIPWDAQLIRSRARDVLHPLRGVCRPDLLADGTPCHRQQIRSVREPPPLRRLYGPFCYVI